MQSLNRFEANLVGILYAILGERGVSSVRLQLEQGMERPPCLSRGTVELVQDAIRKGVVRWLATMDGWKREKYLRNEEVVEGRLWERWPTEQLTLNFSGHTLDFLISITAKNGTSDKYAWKLRGTQPLELGDELFLYKAVDVVKHSRVFAQWKEFPSIQQHPLVALSLPQCSKGSVAFDEWMRGPRAAVLETLQSKIADDWINLEFAKSTVRTHQEMLLLGNRQAMVANAYMDACESAERLDLSRFILRALRTIVQVEDVRSWVTMDLKRLRLADRRTVYEAVASFLSVAQRLKKWHQSCQGTGYFDEGYAAAQLWLADWERYDSEEVTDRALELRDDLLEF